MLKSCYGEQMRFVVVYDLYAVCTHTHTHTHTHTSVSFLCDQKGSRPDGALDVCGDRAVKYTGVLINP